VPLGSELLAGQAATADGPTDLSCLHRWMVRGQPVGRPLGEHVGEEAAPAARPKRAPEGPEVATLFVMRIYGATRSMISVASKMALSWSAAQDGQHNADRVRRNAGWQSDRTGIEDLRQARSRSQGASFLKRRSDCNLLLSSCAFNPGYPEPVS
jgi:hypothetical protein